VEAVKPEVVSTMWGGDVHGDHGAVYDALTSVLKSFYIARVRCPQAALLRDALLNRCRRSHPLGALPTTGVPRRYGVHRRKGRHHGTLQD
jgi:LmbE family N-acetylglucosaminyl deacetylase